MNAILLPVSLPAALLLSMPAAPPHSVAAPNPWLDPFQLAVWSLAAIALLAGLAAGARRSLAGVLASFALLLAGGGLLAGLAIARLLPEGSVIHNPNGTTDDPRLISALLVGLAALAGLVTPLRRMRLPLFGALGMLLPGIAIAGLVASVASFAGLRQPLGVLGLIVGGLAAGLGLSVLARSIRDRAGAMWALQCTAAAALATVAMLCLHGARAERMQIVEGAAIDTLGQHVVFRSTDAPSDSLRRMHFSLGNAGHEAPLVTQLVGRRDREARSVAGGAMFSGAVVLPVALHEVSSDPHSVKWLTKGDSLVVGDVRLRFTGFRLEPGDSIRFFADLAYTKDGRTTTVSPGLFGTPKGEVPFAANAEGFGPIAVAAIDGDKGRVALMLPHSQTATPSHVALVDLRLRPALPVAWAAAGLVALAFLLGLVAGPSAAEGRTAADSRR